MEKLILKMAVIQLSALAALLALMPATHNFGLDLIHGPAAPSMSALSGMVVYMVLLVQGGRWILGDRFFVDPIRRPVAIASDSVPAYARYLARFGKTFLPGTRGSLGVNACGTTPELETLAGRFQVATTRKLRRLEKKEEEQQRGDSTDPVLI